MTAPSASSQRKRTADDRPAAPPRRPSSDRAAPGVGGSGLSDREIVRVAKRIIAESGVEGLTMRRLSTELGVALGATYNHVPTRHELLVLVGQDLYKEVMAPAIRGNWHVRVKSLMVNLSTIVARYPGMAGFMMVNVDDLVPTELNTTMYGILREAGFSERGISTVLSALFFYVTGMLAGGFANPTAKAYVGWDMQAQFEEGLDLLLLGAQVRLEREMRRRSQRSR